ncbi:Arginine-binding extracellular protein ArtP [bioreactor metagenome]|uniref:Arginine-binding extracellular protein ArtP n=1 Tax=bioreactor metagenome TaxID=1076179 RepID=A0A645A9G3_9ZZZZ
MINTLMTYLDEDVELEFAQMEFSTIVTAVQTGQVDIGLSGFTYDADRDVIFSDPYLSSSQVVLVKKDSGIAALTDLTGKTIGAQLGTTGEEAANSVEGVKEVVTFNDTLVGLESLNNGIVDAFVTDKAVAQNYESTGDYIILEEPLLDESVSIIVKNGNDLLADKINELIQQFTESADYETLVAKWGV